MVFLLQPFYPEGLEKEKERETEELDVNVENETGEVSSRKVWLQISWRPAVEEAFALQGFCQYLPACGSIAWKVEEEGWVEEQLKEVEEELLRQEAEVVVWGKEPEELPEQG